VNTGKTGDNRTEISPGADEDSRTAATRRTEQEAHLANREEALARREAAFARREAAFAKYEEAVLITMTRSRSTVLRKAELGLAADYLSHRVASKSIVKKSTAKHASFIAARRPDGSGLLPDTTGERPPHKAKK